MPGDVAREIRNGYEDDERVARALDALGSALGTDGVMTLERVREIYARGAIRACGGNKSAAAKALGINRRSLYRILEREAG